MISFLYSRKIRTVNPAIASGAGLSILTRLDRSYLNYRPFLPPLHPAVKRKASKTLDKLKETRRGTKFNKLKAGTVEWEDEVRKRISFQ